MEAISGIRKHLLRYTHPNNFAFVGSMQGTVFIPDMVTAAVVIGIVTVSFGLVVLSLL